jgi:hypothetical protein
MKVHHLVIVGLLLALLIAPTAWADSQADHDDGTRVLDWARDVVSWVVDLIIEGPDPVGIDTDTVLLSPDPTADEFQSTSPDGDRSGAINPNGSTAHVRTDHPARPPASFLVLNRR